MVHNGTRYNKRLLGIITSVHVLTAEWKFLYVSLLCVLISRESSKFWWLLELFSKHSRIFELPESGSKGNSLCWDDYGCIFKEAVQWYEILDWLLNVCILVVCANFQRKFKILMAAWTISKTKTFGFLSCLSLEAKETPLVGMTTAASSKKQCNDLKYWTDSWMCGRIGNLERIQDASCKPMKYDLNQIWITGMHEVQAPTAQNYSNQKNKVPKRALYQCGM